MQVMTKQNAQVNIYDLTYPVYVAAVPKDCDSILHIPGQFEFKEFEGVYSYVIEAYKTKTKLYVYDVIPYHLWIKGVCNITYEKRLSFLRKLCTAQINNFDKVQDLPSVLIDNPFEFSEYCDNLLTSGYDYVRIMDVNGFYVFGECKNGELLEMKL
jgi:hypothetical protein